jgi:soluble lytic murein transglycosylase-like protein
MKAPPLILTCLLVLAGTAHALESSPYRLQLDSNSYRLQAEPGAQKYMPATKPSPALATKPYADEIAAAADEAGLDPALVHAVIHVESAYRAGAVSEKGALGLMQVMPDTAKRFGIQDASGTKANLKAGTRYLRTLLDLFDQRTDLALAAYNAGEGAVLHHAGGIPPYPETQRYVPAVLEKFNEWRQVQPSYTDYLVGTRLVAEPVIESSRNHRRKM